MPNPPTNLEQEHRPLHGSWVYSLKITCPDTTRLLAKRWRAMEFGMTERVKTIADENYPGVKVVDLFEANLGPVNRAPSLEEAEAANQHSFRFLVSKVGGLAIISSRIGYEISGAVNVPAPDIYRTGKNPVKRFEMHDFDAGYDDQALSSVHLARVERFQGDPSVELSQATADDIFRQMLSGTEETK